MSIWEFSVEPFRLMIRLGLAAIMIIDIDDDEGTKDSASPSMPTGTV